MTTPDTWHADRDLLARYAAGRLDPTAAWSLEQHVTGCHDCRALLAAGAEQPLVAPGRLDAIWAEVETVVDAPRPTVVERLLLRVGVPDHMARLLAATPALTVPWLVAVGLVLVTAALAGRLPEMGPLLFLTVAPLVPLAGVALAFGRWSDPTHEIALAAPVRSGHLMVVRAAAVTATSFALAAVATLLLPDLGWLTAAWMLPGLAMATTMLALSTWRSPIASATAVGSVWVATVVGSETMTAGELSSFGRAGQLLAAALCVAGVLVLRSRKEALDVARQG